MIKNKGIIKVDPHVEYLKQWTDNNGNYVIDRFVAQGKIVLHKKVTGCGFTSYCLSNSENLILVSPRTRLINDKISQTDDYPDGTLWYFNRERDPKKKNAPLKTFEELELELTDYIHKRGCMKLPIKLLVTIDSFCTLADWLEQKYGMDINSTFHIAVDESHCLIKDLKMKEYNNQNTLSDFIARVFMYDNVLFSSATPIIDYLGRIPEFKKNTVWYYELEWSNITPVNESQNKCKSPTDAFDQIYDIYDKMTDECGRHCFDFKCLGDGHTYYSYEAVIFLNSVRDIKRILSKYIKRLGLISPDDVTIICANTKENLQELKAVDGRLDITTDIPKRNNPHKTWTFVTRTAFEGVDFYSTNASTFVIVNYNVASLSLDISSDIPQIVGRQRLDCNLFRNRLHIFYTSGCKIINEAEFERMQNEKMKNTMTKIRNWNSVADKDDYLNDLSKIVEMDPNSYYLKTNRGVPEPNTLLVISERYCRDIIVGHKQWFIRTHQNTNQSGQIYSVPVQLLKNSLDAIFSLTTSQDRIKKIWDFFMAYPDKTQEFYDMLYNEGYNELARYFNYLPLDRIHANGFNTTLMNNEINYITSQTSITTIARNAFVISNTYSKAETKAMIQGIYDSIGLKKTAKSTDLGALGIQFKEVRVKDSRAYLIVG